MRRSIGFALAAGLIALTTAAPTASADVSSAKGKRICKEAGEAQSPGSKAHVNARDIRSTATAYIYRVRVTDAEGAESEMICTVAKKSGEAVLTADE